MVVALFSMLKIDIKMNMMMFMIQLMSMELVRMNAMIDDKRGEF